MNTSPPPLIITHRRPSYNTFSRVHAVDDLQIEDDGGNIARIYGAIDTDTSGQIDREEFRRFVTLLCTDAMLPRLMKTEIELGSRVICAAFCCIPTFCFSWYLMHRYEKRKAASSE
jgi:hypothetical protein